MKMQEYQAILFDLDGVLVNSEPLHDEAAAFALAECNVNSSMETIAQFRGRVDAELFSHLVGHRDDSTKLIQKLRALKMSRYTELIETMELFPGVLELLGDISAGQHKLGLITSSSRNNQQLVFDRFGLAQFFDVTITADDVTESKPLPQPYILAAQKLAAPTERCLVVEDSTNGVRSGVAAGCVVAGVIGTFSRAELIAAGADHVAEKTAGVRSLLT